MRGVGSWLVLAALAGAGCSLLVDTSDLAQPTAGAPASPAAEPSPDAGRRSDEVDAAGGSVQDANTSPAEGGASLIAPSYRKVVLDDRPDGYWRLSEPAGAGAAMDETKQHDGKYVGVVFGDPGPFPGTTAARFDGKAYVELASAYEYAATAAFSIEAWAAPRVKNVCGHLMTRQDRTPASKRGFALLAYGDSGAFLERYIATVGRNSGGIAALANETFVHLVGTYDGTTLRLYVNGLLASMGTDARSSPSFSVPAAYIGIGQPADCGFDGRIAEVAIYPQALTPERIAAHYAAGLGR